MLNKSYYKHIKIPNYFLCIWPLRHILVQWSMSYFYCDVTLHVSMRKVWTHTYVTRYGQLLHYVWKTHAWSHHLGTHKTRLSQSMFLDKSRKVSFCVRGIDFASFYNFIQTLWYFRIVQTVWYFRIVQTVWYFRIVQTLWYFRIVQTVWYFRIVPTVWYF